MIDWFKSKTGVDVPMINGSVLASRFDPLKEAVSFLEANGPALKRLECLFLIGAGNQLIVQELLQAYKIPFVVVVDSRQELVDAMSTRFKNDFVIWKCVDEADAANAFQDIGHLFLTRFGVLEAPSSQFLDLQWRRSCRDFLNGHSVPGFYFQLNLRNPGQGPTICHVLPEEGVENFGKKKALELIKRSSSIANDGITQILSELVL